MVQAISRCDGGSETISALCIWTMNSSSMLLLYEGRRLMTGIKLEREGAKHSISALIGNSELSIEGNS